MGEYKYMGRYVCGVPLPAARGPMVMNTPAAATHFRIPPLHCSFPSLLHPHYELVKQLCDGWILDIARPPSAAACNLLLECVLPRFVCRIIPATSSISRLVHATKMISWFIVADDDDDHPDSLGVDDTTTAEHVRRVMAILRSEQGANKPRVELGLHARRSPIHGKSDTALGFMIDSRMPQHASYNKSERKEAALEALAELWAEMHAEMTPVLRDRFVSSMEDYLHAVKMQATSRKLRSLPDMHTYLKIRRHASFIHPCFAIIEYALGIDLEEAAYNNPMVEYFRNMVLDYSFLCNDLISCKAEIAVGDYFNMPSIVFSSTTNKDSSLQDAIDHVASMIKDLDRQCVSMLPLIHQSSSPSLHHNSVSAYITALCYAMAGSLAWHLETARYRDSVV